ncbi:MAG: hypothetical protein Q9169_002211 [Polycauliona sp. 2 TL-2023]
MSCPSCFQGTIHTGTPRGTETVLHGLKTYVTEPSNGVTPKGVVVIVPDILGWSFRNTRLLADTIADEGGFRLYIPELMDGHAPSATLLTTYDSVFHDTSFWSWFFKPYAPLTHPRLALPLPLAPSPSPSPFPSASSQSSTSTAPTPLTQALFHSQKQFDSPTHPTYSYYFLLILYAVLPLFILVPLKKSLPRLRTFLTALRTKTHPTLPFGACGYCWGAKHVVLLASESLALGQDAEKMKNTQQSLLLDAAFIAHPAPDLSVPRDMENLKAPLSMAFAEMDVFFGMKVVEKVKGVLSRKEEEEGLGSEVVVYPGALHGFATRGDDKVGVEKRQAEEAREQAVGWLGRWFARAGGGVEVA